ncbi:MAG: esterase family protein [Prevotellaceae bacterium]|jgi:enterochelin esterase-like enzyme|nr:esterase family protein [Prevotellaceae bacterium]
MKKLFTIMSLALFPLSGIYAQSVVYETRTVKSEILKMERKYSIYLPAGYDRSDQSYPVLYLLHGAGDDHTGWVQFGQVQHIADKTIAEGKAGPMIIVMPDANTGRRGYFNDIQGDFNYEDFFFKELIPHIEKTYRVRSERRYRAVSGLSMGGGGTIFYALHQPDMFAAAAPLSAATGNWNIEQVKSRLGNTANKVTEEQLNAYFKRHNIEDIIKNASKEELGKIKQIRWYISCGDDDFLYEGNSQMHILFRKNEIVHEYRVKDGGHTWSYWRMELPLVLEFVAKSFMQH